MAHNFEAMNVGEIKALLTANGATFAKNAKKADLIAQLQSVTAPKKISRLRKALDNIGVAAGVLNAVAPNSRASVVVDEAVAMANALIAIRDRVARAPAHVVSEANITNGMDPIEINRRVLERMDAHGIE